MNGSKNDFKKNFVSIIFAIFACFLAFKATETNQAYANDYYEQDDVNKIDPPKAEELWWTANANVTATSFKITASVYNGLSGPIYCIGRVFGNTYYGNTAWVNFEAIIGPGNYSYGYVYTNQNDPFVSGNANIQCRTY